jgi:hypothetical protein
MVGARRTVGGDLGTATGRQIRALSKNVTALQAIVNP